MCIEHERGRNCDMKETWDKSEHDGNLGPTELTKFNQTNKPTIWWGFHLDSCLKHCVMYLSVEKTGLFRCMYDYIQVLSGWISHGCSNTEVSMNWFVMDQPWSYIINKQTKKQVQQLMNKNWITWFTGRSQNRTTPPANQDIDQDMPNNDLLLYWFLYQNEISAVIHDILRDWSLPGQLCALFKPVSSIDQGHINDVSTVSKRPQRNAWWICGYLRAQAEIFPSYLHRPGSNQ